METLWDGLAVVLNRHNPGSAPVTLRNAKGTVLGALSFLIYSTGISVSVWSEIRLFTNDYPVQPWGRGVRCQTNLGLLNCMEEEKEGGPRCRGARPDQFGAWPSASRDILSIIFSELLSSWAWKLAGGFHNCKSEMPLRLEDKSEC